MHILVVGGAGFIGSHIAEYYVNNNHNVTVIDNFLTGRKENLRDLANKENFNLIDEDFLRISLYAKQNLIKNSDYVYNFAAIVGVDYVLSNSDKVLEVNINILKEILDIVSRLDKKPLILTASTSEVYGSQCNKLSEENSPAIIENSLKTHSGYPISKLVNEVQSSIYYQQYNVPVIILRLFNTIGPRQIGRYGMVVPKFIKAALNNNPITVHGDGLQTRSFCDVRDTVVILDKIAKNKKSIGQIFNIGSNQTISILDLAKTVKRLCNSDSAIEMISYEDYYKDNLKNYVDIKYRVPDLQKLHSYINFDYEWTLEKTILNLAK